MCMSKPKMPEQQAIPKADPSPTSVQNSESAVNSIEDRRRKLQKMRFGLSSTIKTSPGGVKEAANLSSPSLMGKEKLGQ